MSDFTPNNDHFLRRYRNIRNELLNKTDKYFLIDFPISADNQREIKKYRQLLRDFINISKDNILSGQTVEFPKQPSCIDIIIKY